ncbi:MAG TPA: cation-translocating P-type ATPase [Candidatus Bathyarchaeia archaeon]|nr:cation-translocating P-type ATPase [Candidatus Bathyarchaeia archaeon]
MSLKPMRSTNTGAEVGEFEEEEHRPWLYLAATLGVTIILSTFLEWFAAGLPLLYSLPLTNEQVTVSKLLYQAVVTAIAVYVGFVGLRELLIERRFSVEFLMSVAALGATYLGFLFEAATVLLLYSLAEHFEHFIEDRARQTVEKLSTYMPENAHVVENGSEKTVNVKQVKTGDLIVVRAGERIPLDGIIQNGMSSVDQSLVTGESALICKREGDAVFAGTLNADGVLNIQVAKESDETLVSRIAKLVIESRKRKASMERLVDRFARFYVPIVVAMAVFVAFGMPYVAGEASQPWMYRSLILLVVSCPSAFVLSVPATFFTAITTAARKGIIIKGGVYVEKMDKVKTVVFDKTGTLTLGQPALREVNCLNQTNDQKALMYAAALEQYSNHPLAKGFVKRATENGCQYHGLEVKNVKELPGKGIVGYVGGCRVSVGNAEFMRQEGVEIASTGSKENEKHTRVYVSINQCAPPSFCLVDQVRNDAAEAVKALNEASVRTVMLTGDKAELAEEVSRRLGVDETHANLFPEDKLKIVDQLKAQKGLVAMVGDGINDAPALAASDVGIAMGSGGVDVALESADIVLVKNELSKIPYLQRISKLSVKIAKQNIAVSLGVKMLLGALGFLGLVPLWFAVATGDDGVTMLLLLNTLRIPRLKA